MIRWSCASRVVLSSVFVLQGVELRALHYRRTSSATTQPLRVGVRFTGMAKDAASKAAAIAEAARARVEAATRDRANAQPAGWKSHEAWQWQVERLCLHELPPRAIMIDVPGRPCSPSPRRVREIRGRIVRTVARRLHLMRTGHGKRPFDTLRSKHPGSDWTSLRLPPARRNHPSRPGRRQMRLVQPS